MIQEKSNADKQKIIHVSMFSTCTNVETGKRRDAFIIASSDKQKRKNTFREDWLKATPNRNFEFCLFLYERNASLSLL